jgi:hypothetical protein
VIDFNVDSSIKHVLLLLLSSYTSSSRSDDIFYARQEFLNDCNRSHTIISIEMFIETDDKSNDFVYPFVSNKRNNIERAEAENIKNN